jgi:hypothetical protein
LQFKRKQRVALLYVDSVTCYVRASIEWWCPFNLNWGGLEYGCWCTRLAWCLSSENNDFVWECTEAEAISWLDFELVLLSSY